MSDVPEEYHEYVVPSSAVMSLVRSNPQEPFSAESILKFPVFSGVDLGPPRSGEQGKLSFANRGRHSVTFETGNIMTASGITQPRRYVNGQWETITDSNQRVLQLDANYEEEGDPDGPAFREAMKQIRIATIVWAYRHREHLFGKRYAEGRRSDPNYDMSFKDVEAMVSHPIDPIMGTVTVKYNMAPARPADELQVFITRHCLGDTDDVELEVVHKEQHAATLADGMTVRARLQWLGVNVGAKVSAMLRIKVIVIMKKNTVPIMSSLRNAKVVDQPDKAKSESKDSAHEIEEQEADNRSVEDDGDFDF